VPPLVVVTRNSVSAAAAVLVTPPGPGGPGGRARDAASAAATVSVAHGQTGRPGRLRPRRGGCRATVTVTVTVPGGDRGGGRNRLGPARWRLAAATVSESVDLQPDSTAARPGLGDRDSA
jgi:hypothetical protein